MIEITTRDHEILKKYQEFRNIRTTALELRISKNLVTATMTYLQKKGIVQLINGRRYELTDIPYEVVDRKESRSYMRKRNGEVHIRSRSKIEVHMTESERDWMWKNYTSDKRRESAKILGRTVSDICLMAQSLEIDMEGKYRNVKTRNKQSA